MLTFLAIGFGAALGAWLRWGLSLWLNSLADPLPYGTLAANLLGGYLVGLAVAYSAANASLSVEWRLFIITGFLGGLTTFSTFSVEVFSLLARAQYLMGLLAIAAHLIGSLALTGLGVWSFRLLKG